MLVVAGSIDYPGAAVLTALGAMRAGAGVVRVAAAEAVVARLAGGVPEATWMTLDEEAPGLIAPGGWRRVTSEAATVRRGWSSGPGLGPAAGHAATHPAAHRHAPSRPWSMPMASTRSRRKSLVAEASGAARPHAASG
jgi:NAD(P)H-hydrate repair Nnr-like enzyme with NAD(P)H-hydrate dehydratase domain